MSYVDFYMVPVPRANREAYEELARIAAGVLRECGAQRVVECWADDAGPEGSTYHANEARLEPGSYGTFLQAAGAREGETVVMASVEWADKETRDRGMQKFTADPRLLFSDQPPVFDGRRLIAGGFKPMLALE